MSAAGTPSKPCPRRLTHPNPQALFLLFFCSSSKSRTFPPFPKPRFPSCHLQVWQTREDPGEGPAGLGAGILPVSTQITLPKRRPLPRPRPFLASRFAVSVVLSPHFGNLGVLASYCFPDPERIPPNYVLRAKKNDRRPCAPGRIWLKPCESR